MRLEISADLAYMPAGKVYFEVVRILLEYSSQLLVTKKDSQVDIILLCDTAGNPIGRATLKE